MTQRETPPDIVQFFLDPRSYQHPVEGVIHRQTHVSHLFFAGDYVYKVKKPVDLGFLDFSTLEKRQSAAIAELELNRRIAPDIYLDVVAVHRDEEDALSFAAPTFVQEVAVLMKRLPEAQRLSRLIETGAAQPEMMADLGRLIADFHQTAEASPEIAHFGSLEIVRKSWDENFEQTEPFIGRTISREVWKQTREEIERFMRVYADLFEERVAQGRIRDCHGDLQTDDTFIDPESGGAHVLDCIEFNKRFRYSDTLADIAFLSMDLRYRGAAELATAFLEAYYAGSDDERVPSLLRFYESYRAYVRGKVRSLVIDQPGPSAEEKTLAEADARRFFQLAHADALRLRPRLVLVSGVMGTGKTTLAEALGRRAGAPVLHSDVVRKTLDGVGLEEEHKVPFGSGIYSAECTDRTYDAMLDRARWELARGNSIILDATWSQATQRARAREAAADREALFAIIERTAPDATLKKQLSHPSRSVTDGRIELLDDQRAAYETPVDDEADRVLRTDAVDDIDKLAAEAHTAIFGPESGRPDNL